MFAVTVNWADGTQTINLLNAAELGAATFMANLPKISAATTVTIERLAY